MTNHERAEKIYGIIAQWNIDQMDDDALMFQITSQLDEAVREKIIELFEGEDCRVAKLERNKFNEGFAAAREKAAGIAEENCDATSLPECHRRFAKRIRAMEPDK